MKTLTCHNRYTKEETEPWAPYKFSTVNVINCGGLMKQTDWKPDEYTDPKMRQYECKICGHKEYLVDDNDYLRKFGTKRS